MSFSDDVQSELRTLARAYLEATASIGDILTFEVEHSDLDLDLRETLRAQLARLSLFGNEYCFDARPIEDFESVVYEVLDIDPPQPLMTIERETQILLQSYLCNLLPIDRFIKFDRVHRRDQDIPDSWRARISEIARGADDVINQRQTREEFEVEVQRLLAEPSRASAHAAAGS